MRSLSVLATATLAFFSTVHAAVLIPRQAQCAGTCLTPGFIPYGTCKSSADMDCLCQSADYIQAVLNCITSSCTAQSDIDTSIQFANALCSALKFTTVPAGVTTAAPGQPKTSASAATTTSAAAPAATTSKSAASAPIGVNQPLVLFGAAAVAFGIAL